MPPPLFGLINIPYADSLHILKDNVQNGIYAFYRRLQFHLYAEVSIPCRDGLQSFSKKNGIHGLIINFYSVQCQKTY